MTVWGGLGKRGLTVHLRLFLQLCTLEVNDFAGDLAQKTSEPCFIVHDSDEFYSPISLFFIPRRRGCCLCMVDEFLLFLF